MGEVLEGGSRGSIGWEGQQQVRRTHQKTTPHDRAGHKQARWYVLAHMHRGTREMVMEMEMRIGIGIGMGIEIAVEIVTETKYNETIQYLNIYTAPHRTTPHHTTPHPPTHTLTPQHTLKDRTGHHETHTHSRARRITSTSTTHHTTQDTPHTTNDTQHTTHLNMEHATWNIQPTPTSQLTPSPPPPHTTPPRQPPTPINRLTPELRAPPPPAKMFPLPSLHLSRE